MNLMLSMIDHFLTIPIILKFAFKNVGVSKSVEPLQKTLLYL
jgi:hypothetical protein